MNIEEIYTGLGLSPMKLRLNPYHLFRRLTSAASSNEKLTEVVAKSRGYEPKGRYPDDRIKLVIKEDGSFTVMVSNGNPITLSNFINSDFSDCHLTYSFTSYNDYRTKNLSFYYKDAVDLILSVVGNVEVFLKTLGRTNEKGYMIPKSYQVEYYSRVAVLNPLTDKVKFIYAKDDEGRPIEPSFGIYDGVKEETIFRSSRFASKPSN